MRLHCWGCIHDTKAVGPGGEAAASSSSDHETSDERGDVTWADVPHDIKEKIAAHHLGPQARGRMARVSKADNAIVEVVRNRARRGEITLHDMKRVLVKRIAMEHCPLAAVALGQKIYAMNTESNNVSVIDAHTHRVTHTIPVGKNPGGAVAIGQEIYVMNSGSNTVSVIIPKIG